MSELRFLQLANGSTVSVRLTVALRQTGAEVMTIGDIDALCVACKHTRCDAVIIDTDLPGEIEYLSGVLNNLRQARSDLPILACGSSESAEKIAALVGTAIDAFIFRPFDLEEIALRIARLERTEDDGGGTILQNGLLQFDLVSRRVVVAGHPVDLTARERAVLQILLRHKGEAIAKSALAERLSTLDEEIAPQTIETYVHGLRRKLRDVGDDIKTVRGVGYLLTATACRNEA